MAKAVVSLAVRGLMRGSLPSKEVEEMSTDSTELMAPFDGGLECVIMSIRPSSSMPLRTLGVHSKCGSSS